MVLKITKDTRIAKDSKQIRISTKAYEKLSSMGRGSFTKKIDDLLGIDRKNPVPVRKPVYRDRKFSPPPYYFHVAVMSIFKTEFDLAPRWEIMDHAKKLFISKGIDKQYPEFFADMDSYKSPFENAIDNQLKARVRSGDLDYTPPTEDDIKAGYSNNSYSISQLTKDKMDRTHWFEYARPEIEAVLDKFDTFKDKSMFTNINYNRLGFITFYRNKFGKDWLEVYLRNRDKEQSES